MRLLAKGPHTSNSISDSLDSGHPYEGGPGRVGDVTFYISFTIMGTKSSLVQTLHLQREKTFLPPFLRRYG